MNTFIPMLMMATIIATPSLRGPIHLTTAPPSLSHRDIYLHGEITDALAVAVGAAIKRI